MSLKLYGTCYVASEPKVIEVGDTTKVCFTGVCEEKRKIKGVNEVVKTPHFVKFEAWDSAAEYIAENVRKGDEMYVEALLRQESKTVDGVMHSKHYYRLINFRNIPKE